jgi:manganese efflux pump family protein
MALAALITWVITAAGGFVMLGTWIAKGGPTKPLTTNLPPAVIFGHFALAVIGLVVWIVYLFTDNPVIAWTGFALLVPVALLGFVMLARWIPVYRAHTTHSDVEVTGHDHDPAERYFPVSVVAGHGLFAVVTVVLVLLAALGL